MFCLYIGIDNGDQSDDGTGVTVDGVDGLRDLLIGLPDLYEVVGSPFGLV